MMNGLATGRNLVTVDLHFGVRTRVQAWAAHKFQGIEPLVQLAQADTHTALRQAACRWPLPSANETSQPFVVAAKKPRRFRDCQNL